MVTWRAGEMGSLLLEACLALVAVTAVAHDARADSDLTVTRGEGATDCPDGVSLRRLALASAASTEPSPAHVYRVSFERSGSTIQVQIVDDTASRTRRLDDAGVGCTAIAQAAAVVLATLWASEGSDAEPAPGAASSASPPPAPSPPAPVARKVPASRAEDDGAAHGSPSPTRRARWIFGAGAALVAGTVRPLAPGLLVDGALEMAHASLGLGALWVPTQDIDVTPGSVAVELIAGTLRGCAFLGEVTQLGICAELLGGQLHGAGGGYSRNSEGSSAWLAIEPAAFVTRSLFGLVRGRVSAGATVPLRAETFSVTGEKVAYDAPAVGGLFSLALELATP